ncbi:MAG: AAA family ATPase [Syntrophobacterales bacterium]|nr:AAA family ATPase [Syntrophobacterales bacterium]
MRILGVRFRNLNSLAGEWQIDFTHPAYRADGIFAITGPTGAGKTTVMDALCLALYGRTPRLDKITKGGNEIMSRQTGECFAEVAFETAKGRYRCHWSQHRARKKADGELQQARHEVSDAASGQLIESGITQVSEFIEKATGMDFNRFTRSMLLAQGGFAAFLNATPDERSPILEQITGAEIYSRISVQVHERRAAELKKIELLQAELNGLRVIGADEELELQNLLQNKQDKEVELAGKMKEATAALTWIEGMAILESELAELGKKKSEFDERQQSFAQESHRLEMARRALELEGDYRSVTALREQQKLEITELHDALAIMPEKETDGAAALAARLAAEKLLQESQIRQLAEGELIKKARAFDVRIEEQIKRLAEINREIAQGEAKVKDCEISRENGKQQLTQAHSFWEAIRGYQTKHGADAALLANLSAIERGFALVDEAEAKYEKAAKELSRAVTGKESARAAYAKKETAQEKSRQVFLKNKNDLKELTEEVTALLGERDLSQWRAEMDCLKERGNLLLQAKETLTGLERTATLLKQLQASSETLYTGHADILAETTLRGEQKTVLENELAALETEVSLLCRIRDLEEERQRLVDGRPCPLCGALEHPYATGNLPVLNEAEARLKKRKDEVKATAQLLGKLETDRIKAEVEIRQVEKEIAEKSKILAEGQRLWSDIRQKLKIEALPSEIYVMISELFGDVQTNLSETGRIISLAEERERQEKTLRLTLENTRTIFEGEEKALQEARHQLAAADSDYERLTKEYAAFARELEKIRTSLLADIEPFGILRIPPDNPAVILKELIRRKDDWQTKEVEKANQGKKIEALQGGLEKNETLHESLKQALEVKRTEGDRLRNNLDSLQTSRRELFGEKSADEEEKRRAADVAQALKNLANASENWLKIEKELSFLKEKIASLRQKTAGRAPEVSVAEEQLWGKITAAGFADEADCLFARLTAKERELIAEKEKIRLQEKTELDARLQDRLSSLAAERKKKMTEETTETLTEIIRAGDDELKQVRLEIGGIIKELSDNEIHKNSQRERLRNIEIQKTETLRWEELHELIGSADGKKFRNFAQGLTFEIMTVHANRQLREMTDRYLLIRDERQPLELNVIDNYQAGEIRSTKNLSGGESFIVSLALALGLSRMASRNVRVDSLFLDEGFGALDEDALEMALEALAGLHQEGKLIGVISHVSALKERLATQIQITPETGGRSSLSGPGCRKI